MRLLINILIQLNPGVIFRNDVRERNQTFLHDLLSILDQGIKMPFANREKSVVFQYLRTQINAFCREILETQRELYPNSYLGNMEENIKDLSAFLGIFYRLRDKRQIPGVDDRKWIEEDFLTKYKF